MLKYTIHREGYNILIVTGIGLVILNFILYVTNMPYFLTVFVGVLSALFYLILLQFFRNPIFHVQAKSGEIIAPADGKIVVIEETTEVEYFKDKRIQISVFMSPFNVHVNRTPIEGEVAYTQYHKGLYLVAWHPKSSTENERNTVVVRNSHGEILFRQIAGALAKRIISYVKKGDKLSIGEEFGFIKFGSRVDIFVPLDAKINVQINDVVKGGRTVLAHFNS